MKEEIASGKMWTDMKHLMDQGHLLACGSHSGSDTKTNKYGIVLGHAFSILAVKDVNDGRGNSLKMVKIRNPHGRTEWTGRYSDDDKSSWTQRLKQRMNHDPDASGDDGTWCMLFEDFVRNFADVYICRLFKSVADSGSWHIYTALGEWSQAKGTAGGCPNSDRVKENTNYYIEPTAPCTVYVSLRVLEEGGTGERSYDTFVGMKLLQKKGRRVHRVYVGEDRASSSFTNSREIGLEVELKPEGHPLTLLPSTFAPDQEASFLLTVASDQPLANTDGDKLRAIPDDVSFH